jgi:hypothetical protein
MNQMFVAMRIWWLRKSWMSYRTRRVTLFPGSVGAKPQKTHLIVPPRLGLVRRRITGVRQYLAQSVGGPNRL